MPDDLVDGSTRVGDLTFKARALAQAHPLTSAASTYRDRVVGAERDAQPLAEFADWAATAFLVGYCIRRVEEADVDQMPQTLPAEPDLTELGLRAGRFAEDVRAGRVAGAPLLDTATVEAMLDRVIGTEIDKRADHWKAQVSKQDWAQFEEYVAWWVIHGYSFRAAETTALDP